MQLGPLGADHLRARLVQDYFVAEGSFRHRRAGAFLPGNGRVPLLLEAAFGVVEHADDVGRVVVAGINWSASAARYPQSTFAGLDLLLARANVHPTDPVVLVIHAATPVRPLRGPG